MNGLRPLNGSASVAPRGGVTLSEVLISTFVMSIGVASLAVLFPISLMRSVQATQLTNATLLRQNAQSLIESNPAVIHDPDGNDDETEHRADVDVNHNGALNAADGDLDWNGNGAIDSGAYLIDPFGVLFSSSPNNLGPRLPRFFGANVAQTVSNAEALCLLPDTWQDVFTSRVTAQNNTSFRVTIDSGVDLSALATVNLRNAANPNNPRYRMILFDITGKNAVIKDLFQVDVGNHQLIWQNTSGGPTHALPAGFVATSVKVEVQEQRYSWVLTVRKNSQGTAAVDVATFFARSFRPTDEFVFEDGVGGVSILYSLNFATGAPNGAAIGLGFDLAAGVAGVDDDDSGTADDGSERGWPGSDDRRTIQITWDTAAQPTPFIKQGGYVLDAVNGNWYRIVQYRENSANQIIFEVDRDLVVPLTLPHAPKLVFFRGVIEVYPLGMRMKPS